ncbi:AlkA N-terminal domain-containing protein [Escherichia coli]
MLGFLAARAVSGVETVAEDYYARSLAVGGSRAGDCYSGYSPPYSAHKFS